MSDKNSNEESKSGIVAKSNLIEELERGYGDPRFYRLLEKMARLHGSKNKDYAQGGLQGHLGNFTRVSAIKKLYPGFDWSSAFGTAIDYMLKQLDAAMILYSVGRQSVTGENIPERLQDVAVYSTIGQLLWQDEQPKINIKAGEVIMADPQIKSQQIVPESPVPLCNICSYRHPYQLKCSSAF